MWSRVFCQYFVVGGLVGQTIAVLASLDLRRTVAGVIS